MKIKNFSSISKRYNIIARFNGRNIEVINFTFSLINVILIYSLALL